jgi:hypothetical protein
VIKAIPGLGPFNLVTAALLLGAGFTTGGVRLALFGAGFLLHWAATPYLTGISGFRIRTAALPLGRIVAAMLGHRDPRDADRPAPTRGA